MLEEEEKRVATTFRAATRSPDSVDVIVRIIGRVKLDHPIDLREIKTALGDVGAEENAFFGLTKLKVGRCTLLLFLFPVDVLDMYVNVIEQI